MNLIFLDGSGSSLTNKFKLFIYTFLVLLLLNCPLVWLLVKIEMSVLMCNVLRHLKTIEIVVPLLRYLVIHSRIWLKVHIRLITLRDTSLVWSVDVILLSESDRLVEVVDLLFWASAVTSNAWSSSRSLVSFFPEPTGASDFLFVCWQAVEMLMVLLVLINDVDFLKHML